MPVSCKVNIYYHPHGLILEYDSDYYHSNDEKPISHLNLRFLIEITNK